MRTVPGHKITWWVYQDDERFRFQSSMRGTWAYDFTCECGHDSKTGGCTVTHVERLIAEHKAEALEPKQLKDMTEDEAQAAVSEALAKLQAELEANADSIAEAMELAPKPKRVRKLPAKSLAFFTALANDAGNWGGAPWLDGNVAAGKSASGMSQALVNRGLVTVHHDLTSQEGAYITFTEAGIAFAATLGIDLSWILSQNSGS